MDKENIYKLIGRISLRGCVAYSLKCFEKYILKLYPEKDWRRLVEHLWTITDGSVPIDVWDEKTCEILPDSIFENNRFDDRFSIVTLEEYDYYEDLYKDVDENIGFVLENICDMEENFAYTVVDDRKGILPEKISAILDVLIEKNIDPPDIALFAFSKREEKYGTGNAFDGRKFSFIL